MYASSMHSLLLINPNTSVAVTSLAAGHVSEITGSGVRLVEATGRFGCAYISSERCFAVAALAALDCYAQQGAGCDAVLLACFGDPGLLALREVSPVPVIGLAESCMLGSASRAGRFSIVTGGAAWKPMLERLAGALGVSKALASVRTVDVTGGQIAADPDAALDRLLSCCRAAVAEDGAREVILGGAGLAGLAARIQPHCPVPLLDSVEVGARAARDALDQAARDPLEVRQSSTFTGAAEAAVATVGLDPALARLISGGAKTPGRN
ncbi:MAG: aspartate/glutamate racemase family protein [bacterium]|nr:aspartate/glutamate racemase family protein [Betaproteobacteria bacterium]